MLLLFVVMTALNDACWTGLTQTRRFLVPFHTVDWSTLSEVQVEFVFAAFSVLVIWLLNPQPEMGPTIYKYLGCAACLVHALVVYALPTW